jgi:hypothetical protein
MPPPPVPLPEVLTGMGLDLNISEGVNKSPSEDLFKGIVVTRRCGSLKLRLCMDVMRR